jgi:hypothetical protein
MNVRKIEEEKEKDGGESEEWRRRQRERGGRYMDDGREYCIQGTGKNGIEPSWELSSPHGLFATGKVRLN